MTTLAPEKPSVIPLEKLIENFIFSRVAENRSSMTVDFYRDNMGRFLSWTKQNCPSGRLTPADIRAFMVYIPHASWIQKGKKANKPITVRAYYNCLRVFYKWLIAEGIIDESQYPLKNVKSPRIDKRVIPSVPPEKLQKLFALLQEGGYKGTRNTAIIAMLTDTGVRLSEILNVKIDDINLKEGLVKVFGKGAKERVVRLGTASFDAMKEYLKVRPAGGSYLWLNEDGTRFTRWGFSSMLRRLGDRAGLDFRLSPHKFRHTFALQWIRSGVDPYTLQKFGGWADLKIVGNYLDGVRGEDALKAHEKASPLDNLMGINRARELRDVLPPLPLRGALPVKSKRGRHKKERRARGRPRKAAAR